MKALFFASVGLIFFAYMGYPACLYLWARFWPRPVRKKCIFPRISIVMAVHNEEDHLPCKLLNLAALDYPSSLLEVIVVSDGSTDGTNRILDAWQDSNSKVAIFAQQQGKAGALNLGVAKAGGEIICFTDARQMISSDGLKSLAANFADPTVGCASGELIIGDQDNTPSSSGVGWYWRFEKKIRNWEGLSGSTVGATGAFYAIRWSLFSPMPMGTILDDVFIPLQIARKGSRVIFDCQAVAWDNFSPSPQQEFRRKVRTMAGNYQLLQIAPWILTPSNPLLFQFVCHKLLRLMVPFALVGALVSTLWFPQGIYEFALVIQLVFYGFAIFTLLRRKVGILSRLSNISFAFLVLNAAAMMAFIYFITGKKAAWAR
ncbi:MAG TPA: glycosyltransferase family 2 protein [Candidatus Acidoferrales bacterium]|jgi:cellulose synthase/poly-beta-1,6-N-acetylglucosamine synthase-like glycosyltransferase